VAGGDFFFLTQTQKSHISSLEEPYMAREPSVPDPYFRGSIQFSLFCIAHSHKLQISLRGLYNLCTQTSLTFDFTLDQEQLPNIPFTGKKGKKTFRRATEEDPSPRGEVEITMGVVRSSRVFKGREVDPLSRG